MTEGRRGSKNKSLDTKDLESPLLEPPVEFRLGVSPIPNARREFGVNACEET